jgi:hypothetical protein
MATPLLIDVRFTPKKQTFAKANTMSAMCAKSGHGPSIRSCRMRTVHIVGYAGTIEPGGDSREPQYNAAAGLESHGRHDASV